MKVIYTDPETAGVIQSEIDRQQLGGKLEVKYHPYAPVGMIAVDEQVHDWRMIADSYAGLSLLLDPVTTALDRCTSGASTPRR